MAESAAGNLFDDNVGMTAKALPGERTIRLREERLAVEKVRVARGAVQIRKKVVAKRRSIDVPVSHEELVIERRRVMSGALGGAIGATETILIPLAREEVRAGVETFVTEEIAIGKRSVPGVERISETLRHEELVVDDDGRGGRAASDYGA